MRQVVAYLMTLYILTSRTAAAVQIEKAGTATIRNRLKINYWLFTYKCVLPLRFGDLVEFRNRTYSITFLGGRGGSVI